MGLKNVVYIQAKDGVSAQARYETLVSTGTLDGHTYDSNNDYRIETEGDGEPAAYLKSASVSGNTLTLVNKDDTTTPYTPTGFVKVLNASDIDPEALTTEQFNTIREGTFVNGNLTVGVQDQTTTVTMKNPMFFPSQVEHSSSPIYRGIVKYTDATNPIIVEKTYYIDSEKSTLTVRQANDFLVNFNLNNREVNYLMVSNVLGFKGKLFPRTYPTDTSKTYTLKYVNGEMTWVEDE